MESGERREFQSVASESVNRVMRRRREEGEEGIGKRMPEGKKREKKSVKTYSDGSKSREKRDTQTDRECEKDTHMDSMGRVRR